MRGNAAAAAGLVLALVAGFAPAAFSGRREGVDRMTGQAESESESIEARIAAADAHYALRHEGHRGGRADPREISEAIEGYTRAAALDRESAEARWKNARSLYFLGTYAGLADADRRAAFSRGRDFGEQALDILARRKALGRPLHELPPADAAKILAGQADARPSLFWTAVDWGQWGLATNKLDAARQGAAHRVRDYCLALIELDPAFEEGGAFRILGRLHDRAPRIPLLTGWVSRTEGLRYLRLAVEAAPENLVNLQFLADALARAGDRAQARALEERILASTPQADHLVEEVAIQEAARANLARP